MSPVAVLVGVPGAGKTTVGQELAQLMDVEFVDTDAVVEQQQGRSVADIFIDQGEPAFRVMERNAVADAVKRHAGVLALGGGAILDPDTRSLLAGERTVWLRVSLDAAARRVGLNVARPLLLGNVRGQLNTLMKERAPLYEEAAILVIDTDGLTPHEVALTVQSRLRPREG